jgi:hypothetical protein
MERYNPETDRDGRKADVLDIERRRAMSTDPSERNHLTKQLHTINNESTLIRSARTALVKATRQGNTDEVKNIHEDMARDARYHNG